MNKTDKRVGAINQDVGSERIVKPVAGWGRTPYLLRDPDSGLCQALGHHDVYVMALRLGVE